MFTCAHAGTAENHRQFEEAMKYGHIRAWLCKLLMYGAAGSGKTSSKEIITGNQPPKERVSTPLAMRPTKVYRVNIEGNEWAKLTTIEDHKMFLARALIKVAPDVVGRLLATQSSEDLTSTESVFSEAEPQIKSKKVTPEQQAPVISFEPEFSDTKVDDILQSIAIDKELVKLMDQLSTTADPLAAFRMLQIIDSGGQPQFHEILPIFLRRLAFLVFVFRLCDELGNRPIVEFYIDGEPVSNRFTSVETTEQLLQHCVRVMCSHRACSSGKDECPQIMILGTHLDKERKETRPGKNRKILKILSPLSEKQVIYHNLKEKEVIFPLNAKQPGNSEKAVANQIRQMLLGDSKIESADIPVRWFALEILLKEMAQALKQEVLSKGQILTVAIEKLHFEEDALDTALQYLDQLSVLFYYPTVLPDVVFTNPQVLLDKVSDLVFKSVEIDKLSKEQALSGEWRKFYEFALVTTQFLSQDAFSKYYVPGLFEAKDLVLLFKKLFIFAVFSKTEYFVPALLRNLDDDALNKCRISAKSSNTEIPSLILQFPDGGPRKGIFCALLCWLVSPDNDSQVQLSISVDEIGSPLCLHRNCVQFDVSKSPVSVTLIDTYTHFEVHVDVPLEILRPKIVPLVHQAIIKGLREATLNLGYHKFTPSLALLCPCGEKEEAHIASANQELGCWTCSHNRKKCGNLTPLQLLWLEDHSSSSDRTASKRLSEDHLSDLLSALKSHASYWKEIGTHLGFRQEELRNISGKPLLENDAPQSWLCAMLSEWLQWAPGDYRNSPCYATFEMLKSALDKSGLAATVSKLSGLHL